MLNIELEKKLPVITMNFAEVKHSLVEGAKKYKGILVTEDGLKDCKAMQSELSSTRIKLDNYRKEVKKEMTKPITEFEDKCKELIALVTEVEIPLKAGIEVFNQKVRDSKKELAESIIITFIEEEKLIPKYAEQLTVIDKYMNLTAKENEVTADIQQRGYLLLQQQEQEIETLQIMNDTIVNLNKNIDAKLSIEDFQSLIDTNTGPVKIMAEINARAERIKANELKAVADRAAAAEKEVQARIAKAEFEATEKVRIEERNIRVAKEEAEETERLRQQNLARIERELEEQQKEIEQKLSKKTIELPIEVDLTIPSVEEKMYFIEMRVEGTLQEVKNLSQFLKVNNYNYTVDAKGEK